MHGQDVLCRIPKGALIILHIIKRLVMKIWNLNQFLDLILKRNIGW